MSSSGFFHRVRHLDAHQRVFWSVLTGMLMFVLLEGRVARPTQIIAAWDAFVFGELLLAWYVILRVHPEEARRTARLQDSSRTALFILIVLAACAAFGAVAFVLGPAKGSGMLPVHLPLSIAAVVGAWLLMHTTFALRYAHLFYSDDAGQQHGLLFPEEKKPDFLDFAYFAFVIGMTSQVSDVQIATKRIRRLALVHGLVSFGFNTMILALTINVVSSLI